ncbi:MAG TPA: hypothetical protein VLT82_14105 [Myxococcaceae bacterium]|nr:hypothetical protein [Myxococcaceae bacterium]
MTPADDEARLRAALAEAHAQDGRHAPAFARMWSTTRRPGSAGRRRLVFTAGLAAAAAVAIWLVTRPAAPPAWQPTGTRWVAPTDFLLDTPDMVTLRTLPTLDTRGLP